MEISAEEFEAGIVKAYQKEKGKFVVDGFRKGKVPRKIIEARFGEDVFFEEAINLILQEEYPKAVDELGLAVINRPDLDIDGIKKGEGFVVNVTVEVYPEIEVKDYKGVEIEKISEELDEDAVQKELEALQKRNARLVSVDREAQDGDTVIIDYAGFVGEDQFEGGTAENHSLKLGSGAFIPGFEEQLIGKKAGEEVEVKVTFPEEYHAPDLAGKEAVFKCKVHEVKAEELPKLDDDFASDVSEFDTLDEFKKDLQEKLEESAKKTAVQRMQDAAVRAVVDANDFDIPEVIVDDEIQAMIRDFDRQLSYQGLNIQQFMQFSGKEMEEIKKEFKEDAEKRAKTKMVIEAVAKKENFEVTDEEIEEDLQKMADLYKMELSKIKEILGDSHKEATIMELKMRKAVDFIYDNAVVK
ncbi:MAG: trigger factor [Clostridiales bacterium]|nr:trigger factor [Clostridiales bacterium]